MLKVLEVVEFDDRSDPDEDGMYDYIYVGRDYSFSYGETSRIYVRVYDRTSPEKSPWEAYIQELDGKKVTQEMIIQAAIAETIIFLRNLGITNIYSYSPSKEAYEKIPAT